MKKNVMREHMRERFGIVMNYTENPSLPKSLNIELNNTCNQSCVFCPYHGEYAEHKIKPSFLRSDFVKDILDSAWELGIGRKELGFYMAGEAFVFNDLELIVSYAKSLGFNYVFITTNGSLASSDRMDAILDAGLDSIRFSVNAGDRETYKKIHRQDDFDRVLTNIKYLDQKRKKEGIDVAVSLSCVVTKKTVYVVNDIKRVFGEFVDDIMFIPIILSGLKNIDILKQEYQVIEDGLDVNPEFVCPILFDTMYINAFGKVVPCCDAYLDDVEFYDLNDNIDLARAWNCESYKKYRDIFLNNGPDEGTICRRCILRRKGVNRLSFEKLI